MLLTLELLGVWQPITAAMAAKRLKSTRGLIPYNLQYFFIS